MNSTPILGINCFAHDSAAAIVADGRIIAAAEEERFTRRKHTGEFPVEAIRYCLTEAGVSLREIEHVGFSFDPVLQLRKRFLHALRYFPKTLRFGRYSPAIFLPLFFKEMLRSTLPGGREASFKVHFVNHHTAHAASTFFASPFERAAILTVDGAGEWATTVLSVGEGNQIIPLEEIQYPHSLGFLYGAISQFLGFRPNYDEGKVMALVAYGKPSLPEPFEKLIQIHADGHFQLNLNYFDFHLGSPRWYSKRLVQILGSPRSPGEPLIGRHYDTAATLQAVIEEVLLRLTKSLFERTKTENLCLAGGVALNCSANGRLLQESLFKRIFVQPASGDGGTALGSALWVSHSLLNTKRNGTMTHGYWGPQFSESEMERALQDEGLPYQRSESIEEIAAGLLAEGKVLGWFQGRMEFGPRALGGRSILADPRDAEKRHYLNREIKGREPFRPFGPSVLEEDAHLFFETSQESPFMLFATKVRPEFAPRIPAVVHEDGTARIQTVSQTDAPVYGRLLKAFKRLTGIPMLLNTSFNLKDEPIVCAPLDALRSFRRSRIDFLALGPFLVWKDKEPPPLKLYENTQSHCSTLR
jgi:carbamoyltransferase